MRSTMSLSNVEYAALKKKSGTRQWGLSHRQERFEIDSGEPDGLPENEPENEDGTEAFF